MGLLPLSDELVRHAAIREGVCVRPVLRRVTDHTTGDSAVKALVCGSTIGSRCPPCSARARRLRMVQCTEGWHLGEEPERGAEDQPGGEPGDDSTAEDEDSPANDGDDEGACTGRRRTRSTRRLAGMPDLTAQVADLRFWLPG